MAQVNDPKKSYQFNILAVGLNPYEAQKVNIPDWELEIAEHGDINYTVKTAGRVVFGDITMEKLRPISSISPNWVWNWIRDINNVITGGGQNPLFYKRTFTIVQLAADGITTTDIWECQGVFPKKINGMELNRMSSDNSIDNIEFSVDRVIKRR